MSTDREIIDHQDGHGLNDDIVVTADSPGPGGSPDGYTINIPGESSVHRLQFQSGPLNEDGSTPGLTNEVLLAVMIDRLRGFQSGKFACRQNALALTKLEEALAWLNHRADERARAGVLGTHKTTP